MLTLGGADEAAVCLIFRGDVVNLPCTPFIHPSSGRPTSMMNTHGHGPFAIPSRIIKKHHGRCYFPVVVTAVDQKSRTVTIHIPDVGISRATLQVPIAWFSLAKCMDPIAGKLTQAETVMRTAYLRGFMESEAFYPLDPAGFLNASR